MKPKIYRPNTVPIPPQLVHNNIDIRSLLLSYADNYCYRPNTKSLCRWGIDTGLLDKSQVKFASINEKTALLEHPVPLYYDAFLTNNMILAIGPQLKNMDDLIGKPRLFLQHQDEIEEVECFQENYRHLSYLFIKNLPVTLIDNPISWKLIFKFKDFEHKINLQKNPFADKNLKHTLVTVQKDNPINWISNWCNHYHKEHGVGRIIIYNNDHTPEKSLPDLSVNDDLEIWYVEWPHKYQQYFNWCQVGALNHSYHWAEEATSYFLNFDIDEYLMNDSGMPLDIYLADKHPQGVAATCYKVSFDIPAPIRDHSQIKNLGLKRPLYCTQKYIYAPRFWHFIDVHSAMCSVKPWTLRRLMLLNNQSDNIKSLLSKGLRTKLFKMLSIKKLMINTAAEDELYFLHYRSLNSNWQYSNEYLSKKSP